MVQRQVKSVQTNSPRINKTAAILGGIVFAVYLLTLQSAISPGDAGELVSAAKTLSVPHPPGYPLYVFFGKIFTWIPVGTLAWRVSLFSAICGTGAAALLFLTIAEMTKSIWVGILATELFAFYSTVWFYSTTAEVFALNNLFCAGVLYLHSRLEKGFERKWVYWGALWMGMGLANHHTLILFALPFLIGTVTKYFKEFKNISFVVKLVLVGALGMSPYLYFPIASNSPSILNWGDQSTASGFLTHLLRRDYGTFQLSTHPVEDDFYFFGVAWLFLKEAVQAVLLVGIPMVILGFKKSRRVWIFTFLLYVLVFVFLSNQSLNEASAPEIIRRFLQAPMLILCGWVGLGIYEYSKQKRVDPRLFRVLIPVVFLFQAALFWEQRHEKHERVHEDIARTILESVPPGSLLFTRGEYLLFPLRYLQTAENFRPDVKILDLTLMNYSWYKRGVLASYPGLVFPGEHLASEGGTGYSWVQFIDSNISHQPIVKCDGFAKNDELDHSNYKTWPFGFCEWVIPKTDILPAEKWVNQTEQTLERFKFLESDAIKGWEAVLREHYLNGVRFLGSRLIVYGQAQGVQPFIEKGIAILERLKTVNPEESSFTYWNLAVGYQTKMNSTPGAREELVKNLSKFLEVAKPDQAEVPLARTLLMQLQKT